jgi:hypothetical protein
MKRKLIPILGLAGLALSGLSAHAQINYHDGDLVLDLSQSGHSDVEADLGNLASLATLSGGSTVQIGSFSSYLTTAGDSLNSLQFSIFGIQNNAAGSIAANTSYLSIQQSGAGPNTAPNDLTGSVQNTLKSTELGILGLDGFGGYNTSGLLPWSAANPANVTTNSATLSIIPNGNVNGYTHEAGSFNGAPSGFPTTTTSSTFSSGGSVIADLFEFDPGQGSTHQAIYDGAFTFNSDGTLDYTSVSAVPEPSVYGMLGTGLLLLGLRHQFRRNQI